MLKKNLIKTIAFIMSVFIFGLISACSSAENARSTAGAGPQISVSGHGKITAEADQATINLNLNAQAATSAEAKKEIDQRINAFFDAVNKLGIKDKQITAGSMNLSPQYDYNNRQPRFIGFQASRQIAVEVSDLEKVHPVLDAAVSLKINGIQGINYSSSTEDKMKQQARLAAIEDSRAKAQQLAEAYGAKLGPVYSISYHSGNVERPFAQPEMMRATMMDASSKGGRFIPGEISTSDSISVVFDLITN